jgi:hypothetical protein
MEMPHYFSSFYIMCYILHEIFFFFLYYLNDMSSISCHREWTDKLLFYAKRLVAWPTKCNH